MQLASTSSERHGIYRNRPLVPGSNARSAIPADARPSHARPSTEAGRDRRTGEPTPCLCPVGGGGHIGNEHYPGCPLSPEYATNFESRTCRCCGHSSGAPMLTSRLVAKGWEGNLCPVCMWAEPQCIARQIPGTRRVA